MNFIIKLLIGILAGILIGNFAPEIISRFFITFEHLFNVFLKFFIPFIIFFFIASGISQLKSNSSQTLAVTVSAAYISTILAGLLACIVVLTLVGSINGVENFIEPSLQTLKPLFTLELPPLTDVMSALICAFIFGIGASHLKLEYFTQVLTEGCKIIELAISYIFIPLLPFYIAGVFANFTTQGTITDILHAFGLVLLLAVTLHWVWLFILYNVAGVIGRRPVFATIKNMLPAYLTGIGTMSSVASLPVTLAQTRKNKVSEPIVHFAIPLLATIHLSGSVITLTTCAIAIIVLTQHVPIPHFTTLIPFVLMLGIVMVAAPGVPGGAVMASLGVLTSMLGFNEQALGLIIALYIVQDSFGTACNITGDGALAIMIDRFAGGENLEKKL